MADMILDNLKDLRLKIDQQHLIYLEAEENLKKIDQREKLESYIKKYLCLAPHDSKFTCQQTAKVLHLSVSCNNNFSAYKAALAWSAIAKYADNLILQPWRKEFRDLKLYCGYFKHEIEESLLGAELMFEAMGYRPAGQSTMTLPGILDPDRITSVSKDAVVAFVECQIMKQIWETLSTHFNISWLEILEFRENHSGSPDQVIRSLMYKYRLRQYHDVIFPRPHQIQPPECHLPHAECFYPPNPNVYYDHSQYSGTSYSYPNQNRFAPVINPQHMMPTSPVYSTNIHPTYAASNILKPQDIYPINGYSMHHHYSAPYSVPHLPHNGYSGMPIMCPAPSVVPTAQLIELESSPTHAKGDGHYNRLPKYPHDNYIQDNGPTLSAKAKDDGAGSWENWDYVYRNLESQGYTKNSDTFGRLQFKDNRSSSSLNISSDDIDNKISTDFTDKMRKLKVSSCSQSKGETSSSKSNNDVDEGTKSKHGKEKIESESVKPREAAKTKNEIKSPKTSPEKPKKSSSAVSTKINVNKQKETEPLVNDYPNSRKRKEEVKPLIVNFDDSEEKWQCITCTYLNSISNNVCEMCYKSKEKGSELHPQPSGGQECPQCTLVNKPGVTNCAACDATLENSPTYI